MDFIKIFDNKGHVRVIHDNPKYSFTRWGTDSTDVLCEDQIGGASCSRIFSSERTYSLRVMKNDYSDCICEIFLSDEDLFDLIMRGELARVR